MHDEEVYPDPFNFKPERFLDENGQPDMSVPQPDTAFFGFGRRYVSNIGLYLFRVLISSLPSIPSICPGKHFASNLAFITMASVLATLDISHATDETGKPIPVDHDVTPGFFW